MQSTLGSKNQDGNTTDKHFQANKQCINHAKYSSTNQKKFNIDLFKSMPVKEVNKILKSKSSLCIEKSLKVERVVDKKSMKWE